MDAFQEWTERVRVKKILPNLPKELSQPKLPRDPKEPRIPKEPNKPRMPHPPILPIRQKMVVSLARV